MQKTLQLSLTVVFAALHAVLYFVSFGLWRNWAIYIEAIEGIILGPKIGFLAAFLGSSIARMARPDPLWMFGVIAEPVSVLMAGFLAQTRWKPVLAVYALMLLSYFVHPFGRALPLWTVLDILFGLVLIYPVAKLSKNLFKTDVKQLSIALVLVSFVCTVTDSLTRVFLLVPCGLYNLFPSLFGGFEGLYYMFTVAAADSYIEDLIVVIVSFLVGVPLLISLLKQRPFREKRNDLE